jgi:two-component system OmpR family sensor kinase/two-component system sensor histidine kinase BaeS
MNQLWARISLTFIAIVIFLFLIPTVVFVSLQADSLSPPNEVFDAPSTAVPPHNFIEDSYQNLVGEQRLEGLGRLIRILLGISLAGILVGVISSRGLAAPLHNLAIAARAVGSQDLSQRIEVRGSSEVREVAKAFNAMAEALEDAERMRNHMLADIAHELRTPLSVIQGNLRAILDDVYDLDKIEVARLYDQTRQLSRLVDDLHDLALLETNQFSLNKSSQDLPAITREVAAIYQPLVEDQGIRLVLDLEEGISPINGDAARITQCLNNLLNNALRHTPSGGEIRICTREETGRVYLEVRDSGPGIDPEHLPYIFDRFYRADPDRSRKSGGSGLGLAITQELVRAHGGEIKAASPGKSLGSIFTISFPARKSSLT